MVAQLANVYCHAHPYQSSVPMIAFIMWIAVAVVTDFANMAVDVAKLAFILALSSCTQPPVHLHPPS